ncbi:MAG: hypothetical protein DCC57_08515 [Chloroflexi bacterium]|nr:MAG: hypothetical protein DCC57_08515 [Chloroflexota bacterium]
MPTLLARLAPVPQRVQTTDEHFSLDQPLTIVLSSLGAQPASLMPAATQLQAALAATGREAAITAGPVDGPALRLASDPAPSTKL